MNFTVWFALAVVCVTVWALLKRYETRFVLLLSGLVMACASLDPMMAFTQFDKSMTKGGLIIAICSAIGFAGVISYTKCDVHLVRLLTAPLKKMGLFLLPTCMFITALISTAIPSMAGLCASVGPTMIPILVRSGFHPAIAAAAIASSLMPAYFNPGVPHNPFISKLAGMEVMEFIGAHWMATLTMTFGAMILLTVICVIYKDYRAEGFESELLKNDAEKGSNLPERANIFYAIAPIVPVVLLVVFSLWITSVKISVATAMLIGMMYALIVTRSDPQEAVKKFFNGMGSGYANILGIIISAGVFAAGLRAAGVIDLFVNYLTSANEVAKIGGSFGPYLLGVLTGSGDAAAFAFNEAVTPFAEQFGMSIDGLGYLAMVSAGLGRMSSPLAGGVILLSGIALVNPMEIVKRSAPVGFMLLIILYFIV